MRNFDKAKRIVIKIGTNILSKNDSIDAGYVGQVAGQVNALLKMGKQAGAAGYMIFLRDETLVLD